MRRLYVVAIILFFFATYSGLWLFTASKLNGSLSKLSSYAKFYGAEFAYDDITTSGFPFYLKLYVKNPKFTIHHGIQLTSITSESLLLEHKLFSKLLSLYFPSNTINTNIYNYQEDSVFYNDTNEIKDYSIICNYNNGLVLSKLNKVPFLFKIKDGTNITDYINLLRYEDHGLNCTTSDSNIEENIGRVSDGNHIQLTFNKKSDEQVKLSVDSHISKYSETIGQISNSYPSIDINLDSEIFSGQSFAKLNFNIEKFLINGDDFSININGSLQDFTLSTFSYSFKNEVNVNMLNYKKGISFLINRYSPLLSNDNQAINRIMELVFNSAQKINDNDIKITLSYDNDNKVVFIGNMHFNNFADKILEIYKNTNEKTIENAGEKDINTN